MYVSSCWKKEQVVELQQGYLAGRRVVIGLIASLSMCLRRRYSAWALLAYIHSSILGKGEEVLRYLTGDW